jgi:TRAP-type mannitol/chloroaromatic compound transport system permease small subunit
MVDQFGPLGSSPTAPPGPPGGGPPRAPGGMRRAIKTIDGTSRAVGLVICWLTVPLFLVMSYEIMVRYLFVAPTVWAYDLSRMLNGAMFMLGAGYGLMRGSHIRADFLYRNWRVRNQARVDLALYLVLFFPAMLIFLWVAFGFFERSFLRLPSSCRPRWGPQHGLLDLSERSADWESLCDRQRGARADSPSRLQVDDESFGRLLPRGFCGRALPR